MGLRVAAPAGRVRESDPTVWYEERIGQELWDPDCVDHAGDGLVRACLSLHEVEDHEGEKESSSSRRLTLEQMAEAWSIGLSVCAPWAAIGQLCSAEKGTVLGSSSLPAAIIYISIPHRHMSACTLVYTDLANSLLTQCKVLRYEVPLLQTPSAWRIQIEGMCGGCAGAPFVKAPLQLLLPGSATTVFPSAMS